MSSNINILPTFLALMIVLNLSNCSKKKFLFKIKINIFIILYYEKPHQYSENKKIIFYFFIYITCIYFNNEM
jgi:hypothetical protein